MDLNATEHFLFAGWVALWLISPVTGSLLAKFWPRLGAIAQRILLAVFVLSLALAFCTVYAPWALRGFWANASNLGAAYLALAALVWLAFRKCRKWLAVLGPLILHAAAAVLIFGGLVFANNQIPFRQLSLGHNLVVRVYRNGFMGSNFDEAVLVHEPPALPFLEHRFYSRRVDYWECTETSARLVETAGGDTVQIVCGAKVLETVPAP